MAVQKASASFRIRGELKEAIEDAFYKREKSRELKTVSAFLEELMEVVWPQYQTAGSLANLKTRINLIASAPHSMLQPPHVTALQPGAAEKMLKTRQEAKEYGEKVGRNRKHKSAGDAGA